MSSYHKVQFLMIGGNSSIPLRPFNGSVGGDGLPYEVFLLTGTSFYVAILQRHAPAIGTLEALHKHGEWIGVFRSDDAAQFPHADVAKRYMTDTEERPEEIVHWTDRNDSNNNIPWLLVGQKGEL